MSRAAQQAYERGYRRMDAYAPYPVEGLAQALGDRRNYLPFVTLIGGIVGGVGAYFLQYWTSVVDYPINVGGRPLHSWPSFIPIAFETTILFAAIAAVLGMVVADWTPTPLPSCLQCAGVSARDTRRVFPLHRSEGQDLRSTRRLEGFWKVSGHGRSPKLRLKIFLPAAVCLLPTLLACRQDMHDQPRVEPFEQSKVFANGSSARPPVPNTVARGTLNEDEHLYAGRVNGELARTFPFDITAEVLARGRERYDIYCAPCHSVTGDGNGTIVRKGLSPATFAAHG